MNSERGSTSLWVLGLVMVVFAVGGIAIDLWRGLAAHRDLAAVVDSAAVAAGSAIDELAWRSEGVALLDASRAGDAVASIGHLAGDSIELSVSVSADGTVGVVTGTTTVDLTLLDLLTTEGLELSATASATPTVVP